MKHFLSILALFSLCIQLNTVSAQAEFDDLPQVTGNYILKNATVVIRPGVVMAPADIIIRKGLIEAVGKDLKLPIDAELINADSLVVYAGFISGLSHAGLSQIEEDEETKERRSKIKDPAFPPDDLAGITPEVHAATLLDVKDKSIGEHREAGFTMAHVVPSRGMLPGKGALIFLNDKDSRPEVLREDVSLFAQLEDAPGIYPNTIIGVIAKFRELFAQAALYDEHREVYEANAGISAPITSPAQKALVPASKGETPVYFKAESVLDLYRALDLQRQAGDFRLILAETRQAWQIAETLKSRKIPVLLSLDLPEDKAEKKDEGKGKKKGDAGKEKEEVKEEGEQLEEKKEEEESEEVKHLKERRAKSLKEFYSQAASLEEQNIAFGFSTLELKPSEMLKHLRIYLKNGLSPDAALSALTTYPSSLLGIERHAGTVEKGKLANLTVFTGPLEDDESQIRMVFVRGEKFSFTTKDKKKKGKVLTTAEVVGSWEYEVSMEEGKRTGTIRFYSEDEELKGEISSDSDWNEYQSFREVYINGDIVHCEFDWQIDDTPVTLIFELSVDGDSMEGNVAISNLANYEIVATRIPDNQD